MEQRDSLDRLPTEDPDPGTTPNHHGSTGGNRPNDGQASVLIKPTNGVFSTHESSPVIETVIQSDIGISTLLTRLKQSIASAREFATFLKKRSTLEEEQAQGLKKLCRASHDSARRPENRQGLYVQNYDEIISIHDQMADNGIQFALSLHQMHEDLHDLSANMERGRKHWKQTGLSAEKRVQDSESAMEKAKNKYETLAEDYDRARTGDKQSGRVFGLKGPKSAAQHEEDLHKKLQQADADYSSRVQTAKSQRQDLLVSLRPQAVKSLQDLINECDSGLTLQLQKFAYSNERLLLSNGLGVSPLKGQNSSQGSNGLRDVVCQIDNARDLDDYVASHASKILASSQKIAPSPNDRIQPGSNSLAFTSSAANPPSQAPSQPAQSAPYAPGLASGYTQISSSQTGLNGPSYNQKFSPLGTAGPPQLPPSQTSTPLQPQGLPSMDVHTDQSNVHSNFPALRPVFGISLEDLLKRDGSAIPLVVYQCIQAVDLYGLEVEGIYRLSGSANHVSKLRSIFDNDSTQIDFRNPEAFYHDVNSVAGLLKQFFRDLPDPLLTGEHYQGFIEAARIDDDVTRRDSMHATINSLPDPNYATLRALTLHLNRIQEHSAANRMNAGNLAIIFGPTLMGTGPNVADAGWQVRVIDTILQNTYQIFDDD